MRRVLAVIGSVVVSFFFAGATFAYDVSYSYDNTGPVTCPANATLAGTTCYCNTGYQVSGKQCVKIEVSAPAQNEIFEEIRWQVDLNDDQSCAQLGVIGTPDKDMCEKYKAASRDARQLWKSIQRPTPAIANYLTPDIGPPGQQWFTNTPTQSVPPVSTSTEPDAKLDEPPAATPESEPAATSTPAITPEDEENLKMGEALQKIVEERHKAPPQSTPATPPESPPMPQAATIAPPPELVALSIRLAAEQPPMPQPEKNTGPTAAQTAQAAQAAQDSEDPPGGIIDRIINFFRWLF